MGQIFIPEILQRALDGLAGALSQAAQGCLADGVRQLLQQVQILQCALVVDDPVQDLQHPLGALPAGDALAAGLLLCKLHEEPGRLHHAGVLVHDHQAAGADHGADALQTVEVQRQVQVLAAGGGGAAGGAADLNGLELLAAPNAAADVKHHLPDSGSHGYLNEAGIHHVACQREGLGARAGLGADGAVPVHALADDEGHVGKSLHIVQHRGLGPETVLDGPGRLDPRHAPVALDGSCQGTALAADEGAGAHVYMDPEGEVCAHDVIAQKTVLLRLGDGRFQPAHGQRILRPDINIPLVAAHGAAGDHHALQHAVGVTLHNGAVHERTGIALVAVADDVFFL